MAIGFVQGNMVHYTDPSVGVYKKSQISTYFDGDYATHAIQVGRPRNSSDEMFFPSEESMVGEAEFWFHCNIHATGSVASDEILTPAIDVGKTDFVFCIQRTSTGTLRAVRTTLSSDYVYSMGNLTGTIPVGGVTAVDFRFYFAGGKHKLQIFIAGVDGGTFNVTNGVSGAPHPDIYYRGFYNKSFTSSSYRYWMSECFVRSGTQPTIGTRLLVLNPTSAGDTTEWVGATAAAVDEYDFDNTTIGTDTTNLRQLFNLDDMTVDITGKEIDSVIVGVCAKRNASSTASDIAVSIKTNATLYDTDIGTTADDVYRTKRAYYGLNPNTGAAWTLAEINALQVGVYTKA